MVEAFAKIKNTVKFYTDKRFSTIAGTLVYFFLMSITPFMLWLTLVFGNVDVSRFLNHRLLEGAGPVLKYLKRSAETAVDESGIISGNTTAGIFSGAGLIFLLTCLYSSTNFFFHLRRSGEIIYESYQKNNGIRLRLLSVVLIGATIAMIALVTGISVIGTTFMEKFLPIWISDSISLISITVLMLGVAIVLNLFACPHRINIRQVITGSLLTTALWLILGSGFGVYLKFASPEKLYGKIASLFVFLLWCYIMMCSFVIGVLDNSKHLNKDKKYYNKLKDFTV